MPQPDPPSPVCPACGLRSWQLHECPNCELPLAQPQGIAPEGIESAEEVGDLGGD